MTPQREHKSKAAGPSLTTDLLILPDGRVLAHNLTPLFADLLKELNPQDGQIAPRVPPGARGKHPVSRR
jgi:hypothetical protein